jgi:hypothetical protein
MTCTPTNPGGTEAPRKLGADTISTASTSTTTSTTSVDLGVPGAGIDQPIKFDGLIGDAVLRETTGDASAYNAIPIRASAGEADNEAYAP